MHKIGIPIKMDDTRQSIFSRAPPNPIDLIIFMEIECQKLNATAKSIIPNSAKLMISVLLFKKKFFHMQRYFVILTLLTNQLQGNMTKQSRVQRSRRLTLDINMLIFIEFIGAIFPYQNDDDCLIFFRLWPKRSRAFLQFKPQFVC